MENTGKINVIISVISLVLSSISYELHNLFSTFGELVKNEISFEGILKRVTQKFAIYNANNLETTFLSTCCSKFLWIPS